MITMQSQHSKERERDLYDAHQKFCFISQSFHNRKEPIRIGLKAVLWIIYVIWDYVICCFNHTVHVFVNTRRRFILETSTCQWAKLSRPWY